ncbi:hypothetical protein [Deinococcus hopiensis]|uniref:Uncharacterized protein n=1 Tax=Deinococcus hopiensis KR-140 TaxID=695939 RepID=A0A1W1UWG5_9DEIO|nr:hypothetical protein [Deinococcus hopiensis]SMB85339.1 hypothetical protein SAMN00790413_03366 [Deinococcus hopiensis KR-140]
MNDFYRHAAAQERLQTLRQEAKQQDQAAKCQTRKTFWSWQLYVITWGLIIQAPHWA